MPHSAYMGQPPATDRDRLIIQGMLVNAGLDKKLSPDKGFAPVPPPNPRLTDSYQDDIVASSCVAIFVVLLVTGIRIGAKSRSKGSQLGWDDWTIAFAASSFTSYAAVCIAMACGGGAGKHSYNVTYQETEFRQRIGSATFILFFTTLTSTKLSIICFNARLTALTSRFWTWVHRVMFVIVSIYGIFFTVFAICQTTPVPAKYSYIYMARHPDFHYNIEHKGLTGHNTALAFTAIHIALDWLLLSIPVYFIVRLSMPTKAKLMCIVPLSVGCLSCIGAAYSCWLQLHRPKDISYGQSWNISWRYLDLVCGVLATSLPSFALFLGRLKLPPYFTKYLSYFSTRGSSRPEIYVGDNSNPFSSVKSATHRDRYDQFGGVKPHDRDLEVSRTSWELE